MKLKALIGRPAQHDMVIHHEGKQITLKNARPYHFQDESGAQIMLLCGEHEGKKVALRPALQLQSIIAFPLEEGKVTAIEADDQSSLEKLLTGYQISWRHAGKKAEKDWNEQKDM